MLTVKDIVKTLDSVAPPDLQEPWDNAGLIAGRPGQEVSGVLISLDITPQVVEEAMKLGFNMIVSHHPPVFKGLKKFSGHSLAEQVIVQAIRSDIALFSAHTNLDALIDGVSGKIAEKLELVNRQVLVPRSGDLLKLVCYVPQGYADVVSEAIFDAGAGTIGNYDQCSFQVAGTGTFRAGEGTHPFLGSVGEISREPEIRLETVLPGYLAQRVVDAMIGAHPYEEVAYDLYPLQNVNPVNGFGIAGELPEETAAGQFLDRIKQLFGTPVIRHSAVSAAAIRKIAVCGGSGSEYMGLAFAKGCEAYVTSDIKYHQWFDVPKSMLVVDVGHYESEQFAMITLRDSLIENFPNFAVRLTEVNTNPIYYY
jgi:dinuclear metal center YbgI/SA1388 family protein